MPTKPPTYRGPHELTPKQASAAYDRLRGTSSSRGYDGSWRRFRAWILASRPLCQDCQAAGQIAPAREVHHIVKLKDAPELRLDPSNVLALCSACHAKRTGRGE